MKSIVSFCLFASLLFAASGASAALEQASLPPQQEERVVPANLALTFTGPVNLARSTAILFDAEGLALPTGKPFLSGPEGSIFKVPLDPAMAPGLYTIDWRVLSMDGRSAQGQYRFRIDP
ncbi:MULTISPECIES: copper resistance protein CopC [unclassified Rhizobium]|uniref:copper resistance CopC family protein n=1 Tax=unclassified Rhizobium TaxID=2613769 RepID=UPI001A9A1255|nr:MULTISPECIES: copper resistance protein CopC [unclassified Rhizobium]MBX5155976.1 copper resistance protein CopC [Rhizobium sp. NZLR8]MBX5164307.1 copper resistance protein CopC [Rhizobium sp. NZLR4b]MBX5169858.1 copper resistance protein CopC [Rhizobium sp. NZLR1b]MBX5184296.1 copper resistance protein CopC [Rhizobium sp. NZLR5]MBX5192310.1 copper resistance protein CopC [Rhizobium sp. NZLR3b]